MRCPYFCSMPVNVFTIDSPIDSNASFTCSPSPRQRAGSNTASNPLFKKSNAGTNVSLIIIAHPSITALIGRSTIFHALIAVADIELPSRVNAPEVLSISVSATASENPSLSFTFSNISSIAPLPRLNANSKPRIACSLNIAPINRDFSSGLSDTNAELKSPTISGIVLKLPAVVVNDTPSSSIAEKIAAAPRPAFSAPIPSDKNVRKPSVSSKSKPARCAACDANVS